MYEEEERYFGTSRDGKRAIVSVKCWDGRFYFVKNLATCQIRNKSESVEELMRGIDK